MVQKVSGRLQEAPRSPPDPINKLDFSENLTVFKHIFLLPIVLPIELPIELPMPIELPIENATWLGGEPGGRGFVKKKFFRKHFLPRRCLSKRFCHTKKVLFPTKVLPRRCQSKSFCHTTKTFPKKIAAKVPI